MELAYLSLCFSVLVSLASQEPLTYDFTEYISPCKRHSPDFNSCIKTTLTSLIPKLSKYRLRHIRPTPFAFVATKKSQVVRPTRGCVEQDDGIPELGVPRFDPLKVPELTFNYNKIGDIAGRMSITNSTATGLADLSILSVRSNIVEKKTFSVEMELLVPRLTMWGDFSVAGRFGLFPVSGGGPYNLTTGEVRGTWRLVGRPVTTGGLEYIRLEQFLLTPVISQFRVDAENVLRGNPQLSKMLLTFTNKFWHILYEQSLPDFERTLDRMGQEALNRVFLQVPFDQLFPQFQQPASAPQKVRPQQTGPKPPPPPHKPPAPRPPPPKPPAPKPPRPAPKPPAPQRPSPKPPATAKPAATQKTTKKPPTTTTTIRTTTKRRRFPFIIG